MKEIWSKKIIIFALLIGSLYVVVTVYLMNAWLVKDAIFGAHSLGYRWNILIALLTGMWTAMSTFSLFLLIVVAMLTGLNLVFILGRLRVIRSSGRMQLAIGGSSILGIVGSGCASCGLPILALLGLSGAAVSLPFRGTELSLLAIVSLSFSLHLLAKGRTEQTICHTGIIKWNDVQTISAEGGEEV